MKRHKTIWCNRGWLPGYFGFCPSAIAWDKDRRRLNVAALGEYPTADARCTHLTNPNGKLCLIVTVGDHMDRGKDPVGIAGLIIHEATHVWRALREDIGEHTPSPEFEAYAMQEISAQLIDAYETTRRKLFRAR